VPWSSEERRASAERLAEAEERRVPPIARRVDLDRVLRSRPALAAARGMTGLRGAYRRLRRGVGLPT
jgi:hypothetical protein